MPDVYLPTLYKAQAQAYLMPGRNKILRCGRRWGKTDLLKTIACDGAAKGQPIGWFTPDYKIQMEAFNECADILRPIKRSSSKVEGTIRTTTGGRIDFWTLENERAGRSRKYKKALIDEAAFARKGSTPSMMRVWETAIKPALLDLSGSAWVASTPNGIDEENFFYQLCTNPKYGFKEFHAPTHQNPYLPVEELEKLKRDNHPLVYKQEYLAEFVDWSGVQFFALASLLDKNGYPVPYPTHVDTVYAVIDSANKSGKEHDGTAVTYWGLSNHNPDQPLVLLDWDIVQIDGALLETWLPTVFQNLEHLARVTLARSGSSGVWIEDKASGTILLQQAQRRGWAAEAIDGALTAVGKDERAISVSGYVYRGMVKISQHAYDKVVTFKEQSRNHLLTQVLGFRIADKDAAKRADDLLDGFTYGISISLGNAEGF